MEMPLNSKRLGLICLFGIFCAVGVNAQKINRLKPGQLYESGSRVEAPRFGFESTIPEGWEGMLPRDTEVFLLMPLKSIAAEIFVAGSPTNEEALRKRWNLGLDMGSNIIVKPKGEIFKRGDVLAADAEAQGSTGTAGQQIYVEAKCSSFGVCIVFMLMGEARTFENAKKDLQTFVDNSTFSEPRNVSIYEGFDWKEFLEGHALISIESSPNQKKSNEVHFCKDGTFYSTIKRKGLIKEEAKAYQGSKTGTWSVESGQSATLILSFQKAPAIEIDLWIEDEKVFANGERHFVGYSEKCNKD